MDAVSYPCTAASSSHRVRRARVCATGHVHSFFFVSLAYQYLFWNEQVRACVRLHVVAGLVGRYPPSRIALSLV